MVETDGTLTALNVRCDCDETRSNRPGVRGLLVWLVERYEAAHYRRAYGRRADHRAALAALLLLRRKDLRRRTSGIGGHC